MTDKITLGLSFTDVLSYVSAHVVTHDSAILSRADQGHSLLKRSTIREALIDPSLSSLALP